MTASATQRVSDDKTHVFLQNHPHIGDLSLQALDPRSDCALLHGWFTQEYARFWNMGHHSLEGVEQFYTNLQNSGHAHAYLGHHQDRPAFLVESYDPAHDQVGKHYDVQPGDWGMHFLVAPTSQPIRGFTLAIIRTILAFHFSQPGIERLVVEPDIRNDKVHELNRKVGFVYTGTIELVEKTAGLAFVTKDAFYATLPQDTHA